MDNFIEDRLKICNTCPYNIDDTCALCGCVISDKVKDKSESCPHTPKLWHPVGEPKVYKQAPQIRIAGQEPRPAQQSNECIPCNNRH